MNSIQEMTERKTTTFAATDPAMMHPLHHRHIPSKADIACTIVHSRVADSAHCLARRRPLHLVRQALVCEPSVFDLTAHLRSLHLSPAFTPDAVSRYRGEAIRHGDALACGMHRLASSCQWRLTRRLMYRDGEVCQGRGRYMSAG